MKVLSSLQQPEKIGPGIMVAMVTPLYGSGLWLLGAARKCSLTARLQLHQDACVASDDDSTPLYISYAIFFLVLMMLFVVLFVLKQE
jgi:hypothetical protein